MRSSWADRRQSLRAGPLGWAATRPGCRRRGQRHRRGRAAHPPGAAALEGGGPAARVRGDLRAGDYQARSEPVSFPMWAWATFTAFVLAMLALDLFVLHRDAHVVSMRQAAAWTA